MTYSSHPPIESLILRSKYANEVPWIYGSDSDPNRKIEARREKRKLTITIRDINIADSGEYTLHANNGKMETTQKLVLRVKGIQFCSDFERFPWILRKFETFRNPRSGNVQWHDESWWKSYVTMRNQEQFSPNSYLVVYTM